MVLASSQKLSPSLPAKAAECTKWESRTADGLTRKGRRSAGRMVSGQFTPFLNTIWRHVGIEGESATPAVDWAKADSQLPEGANARASLKQCELSAETWGTAALDQRRKRSREHLAKIAPRRESWIKHNSYYSKLLGRLVLGRCIGKSVYVAVSKFRKRTPSKLGLLSCHCDEVGLIYTES